MIKLTMEIGSRGFVSQMADPATRNGCPLCMFPKWLIQQLGKHMPPLHVSQVADPATWETAVASKCGTQTGQRYKGVLLYIFIFCFCGVLTTPCGYWMKTQHMTENHFVNAPINNCLARGGSGSMWWRWTSSHHLQMPIHRQLGRHCAPQSKCKIYPSMGLPMSISLSMVSLA